MPAAKKRTTPAKKRTSTKAAPTTESAPAPEADGDGSSGESSAVGQLTNFAEDLATRLLKPLDLVVLSRERIQATLDDAAERGRVTRTDANDLVTELVRRGRQQTEELLGRRRGGDSLPIDDYDELTVAQVTARLPDLTPAQLRKVRDHERRHANRKSVLGAIEKRLS